MPAEVMRSNVPQGSDSNVYVPAMHAFSPSSFSEGPSIEFLKGTEQTLGASELAHALMREVMAFVQDLAVAASFQRDPSIVRGMLEKQLPIHIAEDHTTHEQASYEDADSVFRQVDERIRAALETDPVEDGYTHPAEVFLEGIVRDKGGAAGDWLIGVISGQRWNRSLAAGLLRLLSRQKPLTAAWRLHVIRLALSSPDIELRDAGIQAAESWEDRGAVELLQKHKEPCTWLADYIKRVIRDLAR